MYIQHPSIIKTIEILEDNHKIYLILEYFEGNCVQNYLIQTECLIHEYKLKEIFKQIIDGLEFLDMNGIAHRDIKPENILISDTSNIKIIDFGLSQVIGKNEKIKECCGTLAYISPEVILKKPYDKKTDIWSFGVLLFYMVTGILPFDDKNITLQEISKKICSDSIKFPDYVYLSKDVKNLIKDCLNKNADSRPSIGQIKTYKWINEC